MSAHDVALSALLMAAILVGCVTQGSEQTDRDQSFPDAVRVCRPKRTGRPTQNTRPILTQGPVAECLKRHGWNPDGTRR
jgi:hypothetical protein